jgi:hypothetical protein
MAGRGPQSYQKRLMEQQRKERQQDKMAKKLERKRQAEPPLVPFNTASGDPEIVRICTGFPK